MDRENFERAFSTRFGSCRGECPCGKTFYDTSMGWDWEEGEYQKLEADPEAIAVDYSVGFVQFEGTVYVDSCDCWVERAEHIVRFINGHSQQIAEYLNLEKKRKTAEAAAMPEV